MSAAPDDNPGVLIFPPLLFVICVAVGVLAHSLCPYRLPIGPWARWGGGAVGLAALLFAVWGRQTMKAAGTNVRPSLPALAIVAGGPFAFTRNPLYLGLIGLFAGIGVALRSPAFLAVLAPLALLLHFGVVVREERYLEAKFGDVYRGYKTRVRRWI